MAELLVDVITSLDGYGAPEGWPEFWRLEGPDYLAWLEQVPDRDHTVLMGATTYRLMAGFTAEGAETRQVEDDAMAELTAASKVVFSSTLEPPLPWADTRLVRTNAVTEVQATKEAGGFLHAGQPHPVPEPARRGSGRPVQGGRLPRRHRCYRPGPHLRRLARRRPGGGGNRLFDGRLQLFAFDHITGIEYNSGLVNGVLEILTPSYSGVANNDYWKGLGKSTNGNASNPHALSNNLPLDKRTHAQALPHLNELRARISQSKRITFTVEHVTAPLPRTAWPSSSRKSPRSGTQACSTKASSRPRSADSSQRDQAETSRPSLAKISLDRTRT